MNNHQQKAFCGIMPEILKRCEALLAQSPTFEHVLKFAFRMEAKLEKNRHKGDRAAWLKDRPWSLVERLLDETVELQDRFTHDHDGMIWCDDCEKTADECADVANFAMMVADVVTWKDPDIGNIGPGHVCKHGVRWPHECKPCADANWEASQTGNKTP